MDPRQDGVLRAGWSLASCLSLLQVEGAQALMAQGGHFAERLHTGGHLAGVLAAAGC